MITPDMVEQAAWRIQARQDIGNAYLHWKLTPRRYMRLRRTNRRLFKKVYRSLAWTDPR